MPDGLVDPHRVVDPIPGWEKWKQQLKIVLNRAVKFNLLSGLLNYFHGKGLGTRLGRYPKQR